MLTLCRCGSLTSFNPRDPEFHTKTISAMRSNSQLVSETSDMPELRRSKSSLVQWFGCLCLALAIFVGCSPEGEEAPQEPTATETAENTVDSEPEMTEEVVVEEQAVATPLPSEEAVQPEPEVPGDAPAESVTPAVTLPPEKLDVEEASAEAWPLFRGTALSTGVTASTLPEDPQLLWKKTFEFGMFESTPAIVDDVVYVGSYDGNLYAVRLDNG